MAKNSTARATIEVTTNATKAKNDIEAVNNLLKKLQKTKQLMMKEGLAFDKDGKETATFKKLNQDIKTATQALKDNTSAQEKMKATLNDLGNIRLKDLKRRYRELSKELGNFSGKEKAAAEQWRNNLAKIKTQITQIEGAPNSANKSMLGFGGSLKTTLKNLVAYAGVFAMFNRLKGLMEDVVQKNREMSDQLANIRKVSNLAMSDVNELTKRLAKIDTRSSIQELNELAYVGSKLGFGTIGGIDALEGFVKSALKVNNALKEDLGEDSMMAISKLVEVMGLIPKMGVEKAMDSAGSAIFKLASTSTATGANIIEFSKRLMGLANVSHITTDQLLALGSASDAMGLMPEVSATAFNKVFTSIQSNTKAIEQSLNIQKGELAALINEGKTMEAIVTVFDKMHGMNMDQLKSQGVFKALGSDGARLNNVMITMSDRIDMLKTHLKTSNQAFTEGTAVAQEYAIQMETAEAYMQRASNLFTKAFVNPEGVDLTKEFAKAWYDIAKALTEGNGNAIAIQITLKSLFGILKLVVEMLPAIISGFAAWGFWAGGAFLITQLKQIGTLITTIGAGIKAMSLAGLAGIFTGVAVAAYTLFQHFRELNGELEKSRGFMDGFKKDLGDLNKQFGASTDELKRYKNAIDQSVQGTKQRAAAIAEFNNKFGGYLKNMLTEESSAYAIAKAYDTVTKALRAKLALQLKEKDIQDQVITREAWTAERREEYANTVKDTQYSQYGREWITAFAEENKGRSIGDIGKDLAKLFGISNKEVANMLPFLNQSQTQNRALYTDQQWMVRSALRYIAQDRSARNAKRKVDQKWAPEQKAMDEYLASQTPKETPITPLEERPTKEELAAAKKAAQEAKEAARKELKDAETETNAIISKIEEWYTLQQGVITDAYNNGEITNLEMTNINQQLEAFKNQALAAARRSLSGQDTGMWEIFKAKMGDLMLDQSDWSKELLQSIIDTNMTGLRNALMKFDGKKSLEQWGFTSTAFRDALNKKAAQNESKVKEIAARFTKEAEKMMEQYKVIEVAEEKMQRDLETMGFITETVEQMADRLQRGITKKPDTNLGIKAGQRTEIVGSFMGRYANAEPVTNTNDAEQLQQWLNDFTEQGKAKWAIGLPSVSDWLKDANSHLPEIRQFYNTLMEIQRTAQQREREGQSPLQTTEAQNQSLNDLLGRRITDQEAFKQMGTKFIGMGTIPYTIDITNQREALQWVKQFATDAGGELEGWAQAFPKIAEWVGKIKEAEKDGTLGEAELESMKEVMPEIEALYLKLINYSDNVSANIKKQVAAMMPQRSAIGVDEMTAQHQQQVNLTSSLYDQQINQANATGNTDAAVQLEREKNQAIIELEYQFAEQMYQIQQQMGVNWGEELEHEIAMYQNMLDRQLISEQQFQQKKKQLQATTGMKYAQYFNDQMKSLVDALQSYEIQATENKYDAQIQAAQAAGQSTMALEEEKEAAIYEIRRKYAAMDLAIKISEIGVNTALAIMNAYATLPYPAAIAANVMLVALGAAQTALAIAEYQKVMGSGASSSKSGAKTNVKLASGMLTYDKGNVGMFAGRRKLYDDGTTQVYDREGSRPAPFVGQDGHVYMATPRGGIPEGVSLVKQPIATTVNGQPALVAEKGPEIVIGRRTTARIMMNEPRLLHHLATLGNGRSYGGYRGLRTFDEGNLGETVGSVAVPQQQSERDQRINAALAANAAALEQNAAAMAAFSQVMQQIQANGIQGVFREYGAGSLDESMRKVNAFRRRYPTG